VACPPASAVSTEMVIYYVAFFALECILLGIGSLIRSRTISIAAVVLAIAFCGLRYETGYDYNSYRSFFEDLWTYEGLLEPGFFYFVDLANIVGASTFALFFLFALVTHGLAYYTLRKVSVSPNLAFLIYLLIPGLYLNSFSILRQAFAVSVFAYATYRLIAKESKLEYVCWGLLATSFHFTAALPFLVAFAMFRSAWVPTRGTCLLLLIASLIISQLPVAQTLLGMFGGTKFESYAEGQEQQGVLKIIASNLLALFIIYHARYFERSKALMYFLKLWLTGAILYNCFVQFTPVTRISYYFGFFSIPLLIYIVEMYRGSLKLLTRASLILFFAAGFVVAMYNDSLVDDYLNMSNYKTIIEAP
jgi:transmembrane protein EpsG